MNVFSKFKGTYSGLIAVMWLKINFQFGREMAFFSRNLRTNGLIFKVLAAYAQARQALP